MLTRRPPARGFTLVEIMVTIAIGVILAAAFVPAIMAGIDRARVNDSAESLAGIVEAVGLMWRDTGRFPGRLSHLAAPVAAGDPDICGANYAAAAAAWAGPYLNRPVPSTGLPLPIGIARDLFEITAPPPATLLRVVLDDVSHEDAVALDRRVDGGDGATTGAVRWGAVGGAGTVVLSYARPIRPC